MSLTPIYRGIVLILVLNAIPTYEPIFNTYRPSWTSPGRLDAEKRNEKFKRIWLGVVFGVNLDRYDVHFRERWHRFRVGYPISPVTIDFEERKKQVQGRIEFNWLLIKLGASIILWLFLEVMLSCIGAVRGLLRKR